LPEGTKRIKQNIVTKSQSLTKSTKAIAIKRYGFFNIYGMNQLWREISLYHKLYDVAISKNIDDNTAHYEAHQYLQIYVSIMEDHPKQHNKVRQYVIAMFKKYLKDY
jgi:hypothetical protein